MKMKKTQLAEFFENIGIQSHHAQVLAEVNPASEEDKTDYQYLNYHMYPFELLSTSDSIQLQSHFKLKSDKEILLNINYTLSQSLDSMQLKEPFFDGSIQCSACIDISNKTLVIQDVLNTSMNVNTYEEDLGIYVFKQVQDWFEEAEQGFMDYQKLFTYIQGVVLNESRSEKIRADIFV